VLRPLEQRIYRLCGIKEDQEQRWTGYAGSLLMFSLVNLLLTYLAQRIQGFLPFNPQGFGTAHAAPGTTAMTPELAFNTAVSFTTNTNWQAYTPEITVSYLTQTQTLQGSGVNEPRPQVYQPVFQAYGTYVLPVSSGLTVVFGKWASALGVENNYGKDQMNSSRFYLFNYLPFYHLGFRSSYNLTPWMNVNYWLVNGTQQSEDFNNNKSQVVLLDFKPARTVSWNVNYYAGYENRDTVPDLNPGLPVLPTQPGLSPIPLRTPRHRLQIFDSYVTWNAKPKLTLTAEGDYVVRHQTAGAHVSAAAAYARWMLTEWRRDFSNQPFFLTDSLDVLKREQNTATLGLIWWFGRKQGAW